MGSGLAIFRVETTLVLFRVFEKIVFEGLLGGEGGSVVLSESNFRSFLLFKMLVLCCSCAQ